MTSEAMKRAKRKYQRKKRKQWREAGLCSVCGKETGGYYRCEKCRKVHTRQVAKAYQKKPRMFTKARKESLGLLLNKPGG